MDLVCQARPATLAPVAASSQPLNTVRADEAEQEVFDRRIEGYAARCAAAWAEARAASPEFGADVCLAVKLEREHRADRYLEDIEWRLRRWPAMPAKRPAGGSMAPVNYLKSAS